jgi:hypothetical protein
VYFVDDLRGNVGEPLFDPAALRENPSHFQRRSRTVGEKLQALLTEDNVGTSIFERQFDGVSGGGRRTMNESRAIKGAAFDETSASSVDSCG